MCGHHHCHMMHICMYRMCVTCYLFHFNKYHTEVITAYEFGAICVKTCTLNFQITLKGQNQSHTKVTY